MRRITAGAEPERLSPTTLAAAGITEADLQGWIIADPGIIDDDPLIITAEYEGLRVAARPPQPARARPQQQILRVREAAEYQTRRTRKDQAQAGSRRPCRQGEDMYCEAINDVVARLEAAKIEGRTVITPP